MSESEAVARDEFFDSLLGDFLDESGQLLDRLNENLLQLDEWVRSLDDNHHQRCDDELMNEMFRSAHSLKGLSAMLGLTDINQLTHKIENVFDAARKDELYINGDCVELMFQAIDRLVSQVDVLKDPDAEPIECESIVSSIGQLLESAGAAREQTSQADAEKALGDLVAEAAATPTAPLVESAPDEAETPAEASVQPLEQPVAAGAVTEPDGIAADDAAGSNAVVSDAVVNDAVEGDVDEHGSDDVAMAADDVVEIENFFDNIEDEVDLRSKYLSIFIDEADISIDQLNETLLAIEDEGGPEAVEMLLVTSHRIKGSAASVGLNRSAKLAHMMEDLLQYMRDNSLSLTPELTDALLQGTDALRQFCEALKQGNNISTGFQEAAQTLLLAEKSLISSQESPPTSNSEASQTETPTAEPLAAESPTTESPTDELTTPQPASVPDALRQTVASMTADPDSTLVGCVVFQHDLPLVGLKARLVFEKLSNLGDVIYFDPPAETLDDLDTIEAIRFGLVTEKPIELTIQQTRIAGVNDTCIEHLHAKRAASPSTTAKPTAKQPAVEQPTASNATPAASTPAAPTSPIKPAAPATKGAVARPAKRATPVAATTGSSSKPTETLRVDIERLDQLMNLAGQLVINKARFTQIGDSLKSVLANKQSSQTINNIFNTLQKISNADNRQSTDLQAELENVRSQARRIQNDLETIRRDVEVLSKVRGSVNDLFETIHQLDRVSDGIQQSVMDTRMVPIGPLFTRFKRVVRDITRTNGKTINLVINGEKTELDKRMIDELGDPLIHMVRNSADHGIELPEVREAAGKPRQGTVTLDAFHRGNSIIIQVRDDGKGLDPEGIKRKALEKGIVTEADLEKMTRQQVFQLIWEPGLSTAEKVTEVSGRGMGMDIVKSKIEDINGTIDLDSEPGRGTTITVKLPLTLAILPSLMVEIDRDTFAMPLESVVEIVSVGKEDLSTVHGCWTARVRGRVISTVHLSEIFTWAQTTNGVERTNIEETTLVIVGEEGREIGLAVDRVLGEEDIVIKSMAENYRNVPGIAGASILGDGRVSLILDLTALIEMTSGSSANVVS